MKELLIIRSASFQQLDLNLPEIKRKFPEHNISLLTHEHGVKLAEKYTGLYKVYTYDSRNSFSKHHKVKALEGKRFDAVIVLVTNITGASFSNVFSYAYSLKSEKWYMCNVVSEIKQISKLGMYVRQVRVIIENIIAGVIAVPLIVCGSCYLFVKLKLLEDKR